MLCNQKKDKNKLFAREQLTHHEIFCSNIKYGGMSITRSDQIVNRI